MCWSWSLLPPSEPEPAPGTAKSSMPGFTTRGALSRTCLTEVTHCQAQLCVQGRKALYSFCLDHGVPHKQLGKLIVATNVCQICVLERLQNLGKENGVNDLCLLEGFEAIQMEPQLQCVKALWSPSTGILDSHAFMLALQADAEEHGTTFACNTSVFGGAIVEKGIELHTCETAELNSMFSSSANNCRKMILCANTVINAAGLSAGVLATKLTGYPTQAAPKIYYARGCYFSLSGGGKFSFSHLVYPIPEEGGLGVHVTLDLGGQVRFGPDVEWLKEIDDDVAFKNLFDYTVDPGRAEMFYPEVRRYYPSLLDGALKPDYAGIRPKLSGPGLPAADFVIQGEASHRVPQLVNLFGIESPGLTASLAIANMVSNMLD